MSMVLVFGCHKKEIDFCIKGELRCGCKASRDVVSRIFI